MNGRSKFTEEKVLAIREEYESMAKKNKAKLARKYKVHPCTIDRIVTRKQWQHIQTKEKQNHEDSESKDKRLPFVSKRG
jgi:hypothetical protein